MKITIRLYGSLRDLLPPETRGQTTLTLPEGAAVKDALTAVGLPDEGFLTAVNGENVDDNGQELADGDHVLVFAPSAGG